MEVNDASFGNRVINFGNLKKSYLTLRWNRFFFDRLKVMENFWELGVIEVHGAPEKGVLGVLEGHLWSIIEDHLWGVIVPSCGLHFQTLDLDSASELVDELRLHFALDVIFQNSSEIVLQLVSSEMQQNFLPIRRIIKAPLIWSELYVSLF